MLEAVAERLEGGATTASPTLVEAREIIAEFHLLIRRKTEAGVQ